MPDATEQLITEIYQLARRDITRLKRTGDDDFSFAIPSLSCFRVSTYMQLCKLPGIIAPAACWKIVRTPCLSKYRRI